MLSDRINDPISPKAATNLHLEVLLVLIYSQSASAQYPPLSLNRQQMLSHLPLFLGLLGLLGLLSLLSLSRPLVA